jgi:hypothetical protein
MVAIIVPTTGTVNVNATAVLETNKAQSFAFSNAADMTFNGSLGLSAIRNAFDVTGSTTSSENFSVTLSSSKGALATALDAAIRAATSTAAGHANPNNYNLAPSGSILSAYLLNVGQYEMDQDLNSDSIADSLAAAQMKSLELTDLESACSTGASGLVDAISNAQAGTIALQYNNARWITETNGTSALSPKIPFNAGDTVLFRFYISQTYGVTADPHSEAGAPEVSSGAGTTDGAVQGVGPSVSSSGYTVPSKVCDFVLTLQSDD